MTPTKKRTDWTSELVFVLFMSLSIAAVIVLFIALWSLHEPYSNDPWGISNVLAGQIISSYAPVVGASLLAFRNSILRLISFERKIVPRKIRNHHPLYALSISGIIAAIAALLYVGLLDPSADRAKWVIGIGATIWAGTIGAVISRFFSTAEQ